MSFDWHRHRWLWITLHGVIALILLYFTEFLTFAGLLRHNSYRSTYVICRISSSTFGQNWPTLQRRLLAIAEPLFNHQTNTRQPRAATTRQKYIRGLLLSWNWKFLKLENSLGHMSISPLNFSGSNSARFWREFWHQSPLSHSGFETEQHIVNLKHPPWAATTELRLDSDIFTRVSK